MAKLSGVEKKLDAWSIVAGIGVIAVIILMVVFLKPSGAPANPDTVDYVEKPAVKTSDDSKTTSTPSKTVKVTKSDSGDDEPEETPEPEPAPKTTSTPTTSSTTPDTTTVGEVFDCGVDSSFIYQSCWWVGTRLAEVTVINNGRGDIAGAYIYVIGESGDIRNELQIKEVPVGTKRLFRVDVPYYENRMGRIAKIKLAPVKIISGVKKACANQIQIFDPNIDCK